MKINFKDGTRGSQRLCDTCTRGEIMRGEQLGHEYISCTIFPDVRVNQIRVVECTAYADKKSLSLYQMSEIAWVIVGKKNTMGFVKPTDFRKSNPDEPIVPPGSNSL